MSNILMYILIIFMVIVGGLSTIVLGVCAMVKCKRRVNIGAAYYCPYI